jgi:hypothetical protein
VLLVALNLFASLPHGGLFALIAALAALGVMARVEVPAGGADPGAGGDPNPGSGGDPGSGGGDPADDRVDDFADLVPRDSDDRHADAGDGDDDDEDDDADLPAEVRDDPKRLRTRLRRTQRQLAPARPILDRLRDPRTGRLMDERTVDTVLSRARDMEALEALIDKNPELARIIAAASSGKPISASEAATVAAAAGQGDAGAFNEEDLPFDTSTDSGKFFATLARRVHEQDATIRRLNDQLGQVNQRDVARTVRQVEGEWKTQTIAAANRLPEQFRHTFANAVYRAFELAKRDRSLGRVSVRDVIARELQPYARYVRQQQRGDAAAAQRRATNNNNRPGPVTRGTAPARPDDSNRGAGTIRDARQSFFKRIGATPTPGGRR